jgi:CubicO group peptidase (beta-lactamase class C family)
MLPSALFFLAATLAGAGSAATQPVSSLADRADKYLTPAVRSHEFNGVVLVTRGKDRVLARTYGKASWELDAPFSTRTRFRIASITKTFTAAAVVMLAERGKLSLTDPLSKYLPQFPNAERIQIRHLLGHSSGVQNPDAPSCGKASLDDLVRELSAKPLWFEPGKSSRYSNGGYVLLAKVIEISSGRSWEAFLHDEIFAPLGLRSTLRDMDEPIVPDRASGYMPGPSLLGIVNAPCTSATADIGSGALLSTAEDLAVWARAVRDQRLFKRAALEYPYGWGARRYFDRDAIEQSGILNGTASYLAEYLEEDLSVVVLSNVQSGSLIDIGKGIAALTLGLTPPPLNTAPPAIPSTAATRQAWLGRWANESIGKFRLIEQNGSLYQIWGDAPSGSYVTVTGAKSAFNTQESGSMEIAGDTLTISWSGSRPQEFRRQ